MRPFSQLILCLSTIIAVVGCASPNITERQEYRGGKIPRPAHILVYNFAATAAEVPTESALAKQNVELNPSQTVEQIAAGRQVGAQVATVLVKEIRDMGLPAQHASSHTKPQIGDLVIKGYVVSIDEGSAVKRVAIGFGSGASELKVMAEVYLMTDTGLRKLASGALDSSASKTPGAAVGAATFVATANPAGLIVSSGMKVYGETSGSSKIEGRADDLAKDIAKVLRVKFKEQGWIYR